MTNGTEKPITTRQLKEATAATLDILRALVIKDTDGDIVARAGWTIELVFLEGDTLPVRQRAWQVVDAFIETVGAENLVYWRGGAPKALTSKPAQAEIVQDKPKMLDNPKGYAMVMNLASGSAKPPDPWVDNVQDFRLYCRVDNEEGIWFDDRKTPGVGPGMSFIRMHLPVSWVVDQSPERGAGALTQRMVELMQPLWCTAGWGVMATVNETISPRSQGQQMLYPWLQRFPGLNAIAGTALMGTVFNNAMHSVNWLNYVSDPLLDQLGGREAVRQQVKASKYLVAGDVGNCLGIRAGGFFGLGDTQRGTTLPAFGEAARLLKPIRIKAYAKNRSNMFVAPPPYGSYDEKAQYLAGDAYLSRFDLF